MNNVNARGFGSDRNPISFWHKRSRAQKGGDTKKQFTHQKCFPFLALYGRGVESIPLLKKKYCVYILSRNKKSFFAFDIFLLLIKVQLVYTP